MKCRISRQSLFECTRYSPRIRRIHSSRSFWICPEQSLVQGPRAELLEVFRNPVSEFGAGWGVHVFVRLEECAHIEASSPNYYGISSDLKELGQFRRRQAHVLADPKALFGVADVYEAVSIAVLWLCGADIESPVYLEGIGAQESRIEAVGQALGKLRLPRGRWAHDGN